jgi:hypothetical protein
MRGAERPGKIMAGLLTEGKSARIELGKSILTLESVSDTMLKGESPLFQRLPRLIEETDDAALRWKYRGKILRRPYYHLMLDPASWIEEGLQYFNARSASDAEGHFIYYVN